VRQIIIIGSGPAGYTAAIYAARANLKPLVIAGAYEPGGELMKTTEVENFPGFPDGIMGPELMERMRVQAERFGALIVDDEAEELELSGDIKKVVTDDGETHLARSVIISTGSAHRKLGLENEDKFSGRGVSYCATCDGAFFEGKNVAVVGGGDTAMEEALFLAKFAESVTVLVRGNELKASKVMADRARSNTKIEFLFGAEVTAIGGEDKLTNIEVKLGPTAARLLYVEGLFIAIGNDPRTSLVASQLELDRFNGCIKVQGRTSQSSERGVFAAGDVIDSRYRQAITAAASGCAAAQDVEHFLASSAPALLEAATA
jgi:thioredoxin reductase (NADPH)